MYSTTDQLVKMLVGNKIDKPNREVTTKEGLDFAREKAMLFIECSAKNRVGVKQAFDEVTTKVGGRPPPTPHPAPRTPHPDRPSWIRRLGEGGGPVCQDLVSSSLHVLSSAT